MSSIGRYVIDKELGRGAMGVVYLAQDPNLHRQVAVKTCSMPDGITEDLAKEFHERFLREARAAASLSHPGIVTVYDAGEDKARGLQYIAMEYVPGETLKQRLEKGRRLDPAWVLGFGAVLADALQVAHRAGIVHRDIKPANILIREGDGAVKIADFGVARLKESELTSSGASIGSPGYMSPEQVKAGALDGRSDLFSLAVVLYEALCGKRPFRGDDLVSLAYSIAHDTQVPLARQMQNCPPGLDKFFERALSKDPDKRFPDGTAFREALVAAGRRFSSDASERTIVDAGTVASGPDPGRTLPASAVPPRGNRRSFRGLAIAAMALLVFGLAAAAAYMGFSRPALLKADQRATAVSRPLAGGAAPQNASRVEAEPLPQEKIASRQAASGQSQVAPGREAGSMGVEPVEAPPRIPRSVPLTVPAGTEIHLTLNAAVGSSSSRAGDTFTARIVDPVLSGDRVVLPAGSSVHGQISDAIPARKGLSNKAGSLSLAFDRVATPAGYNAAMSASLTETGTGSGKKNAAIIGGSAAGGALLGKLLGGSSKKAAVGSVLGGAIGAGVAAGSKGEDVDLPAGSPLTITLDQPLTISVSP
jgi:predicted Ser/Thr protein kinase